MTKLYCKSCGEENSFEAKVSFRADCMKCGMDLHTCEHCIFFDNASYNECKEPSADRVLEKNRANYCEFYLATGEANSSTSQKEKQKLLAEALFKKK